MKHFLLIALFIMPMQQAAADPPLQVPPTDVRPVTDTLHGLELVDPYRWLEGDAQGNATDEVRQWTAAQNNYTRQVLDNLPGRAALEERLTELMTVGYIGAPAMRGNIYFNTERQGDQNQPVLYVREGYDGEKRVLLDVNTLSDNGLTALGWWSPNPDGTYVAYGLYNAGDENTTLRILGTHAGVTLERDVITGKVGSVQWMPDGQSFFYSKLADVNDPYSKEIRYHEIGHDPAEDRLLFAQYKEGPLATTWGPFFSMQREGQWSVIGYYTSTSSNDLWLVDVEQWLRTGELTMTPLIEGADANTYGQFVGDRLLLTTQVDAPNGMVYAVDVNNPASENWEVFIAHDSERVLEDMSETADWLVLEYQYRAQTQLMLVNKRTGERDNQLELPGIGSASVSTRYDRNEYFLQFTSFNEPTSIYRYELPASGEAAPARDGAELWARADVPVDPDMLEVKQVTYESADGTEVSMFIVHKRGIELDGNNPTLLTGYGGFGISQTPYFSATMFAWYEAGGVMAMPNLRGGGEYGDDWHKAGMLGEKQNSFDDFIAAAHYLIDQGYTNPQRLAIRGGSNGGLLVGAALTQHPELFAAVVCEVPLLDMVRYPGFLMARYWVPEYGDPTDPEQFAWLNAYSPYHNVRPGTAYPATLLTAGENDTRVHPMHARKMAALLQAVTTSDQAQDPILLWVDQDGGHGGGKPLSLRIRDIADSRIFLMWQLGMLE